MEIKEFAEIIRGEMEKMTELEVRIQQVPKNNGVILHGLNIIEPGVNVMPTIYLEPYFVGYNNGDRIGEIVEYIYASYKKDRLKTTIDMDWFRDFEQVKDKVAFRLINYNTNKNLLNEIPHEKFMDLAKVYYVTVDTVILGKGTILIHSSHLKMWDITVEQLGEIATENTPKLFPMRSCNLGGIAKNMFSDDMPIYVENALQDCPLYIATNISKLFGAAVMCYPNVMKELAAQVNSDIFIIPSSVHELLFIKTSDTENVKELKAMVYEVNRTQVEAEEVLSDSVYYYSRETDTITVA